MPLAPQQSMALVAGWTPGSGLVVLVNAAVADPLLSLTLKGTTDPTQYATCDLEFSDVAGGVFSGDVGVEVRIYIDTVLLFIGTIRHADFTANPKSTYVRTTLSAQARDPGPPVNEPPSDAPWGLSDVPNGTTLRAYRLLSKVRQRYADGYTSESYEVVMSEHGLWVNRDLRLVNAALSINRTSLIVEAELRFLTRTVPEYRFTLDTPQPKLIDLLP